MFVTSKGTERYPVINAIILPVDNSDSPSIVQQLPTRTQS